MSDNRGLRYPMPDVAYSREEIPLPRDPRPAVSDLTAQARETFTTNENPLEPSNQKIVDAFGALIKAGG